MKKITSKQYAEKIVELAYYNFPLVYPKETVIKCVDALVQEYAIQEQSNKISDFLDYLIENPDFYKPNKPSIMLANEYLKKLDKKL